jgi:hypothetical protein
MPLYMQTSQTMLMDMFGVRQADSVGKAGEKVVLLRS